ncbi:MAG: hypothetical protein PHP17_03585 [Candidatus Omnitrophica bacterium]|nr:hypothetical protein [Candidatus Omnitrophota bacterium]
MKYVLLAIFGFTAIFIVFPGISIAIPEEKVLPMQDVAEITGRIDQVDYERSMILMHAYLDEAETKSEKYNIYVLENAVIENNGQPLKLTDLFAGNMITVSYVIAENGEKEASHIWLKGE